MIKYLKEVSLHPIDSTPLETLRGWRNDYRIWKWCRQNDLITISHQLKWKDQLASDPSIRMYSIFKNSSQPVGVCGLTGIDLINQRAEFSLYIASEFHGQSLGKAALKSLISHGFNAYPLHVIYGETFEENSAAKLFDQLGFVREGTLRSFYFREGRFLDAHRYSILRGEWRKSEEFKECREPLFV